MTEEQPEKVRSGWARALEIIKLTRLRSGSVNKKNAKIEEDEETSDLSNDSQDQHADQLQLLSFQHSDLMFPPKQQVLVKLTELITQMNHPEDGLTTFEQDFSEVFSGECFQEENCTELNGEFALDTDGAFTTAELVDWLMEQLDTTSEAEACHLGAMLCRTGFIFPCNTAWDLCTLKLDREDGRIWRFQCPYYWPAENHIASETDHARHLLRRQFNSYGIPFEDSEQEYLSKLELVFNELKWELLKKTAGLNIGTGDSLAILPQMLIASWQDYAYWKVNRPPCCHECATSTNAYEWAIALRGLNRNIPYDSIEDYLSDGQCTEEHCEEDGGKAAANDTKSSCNRIIGVCKKLQEIDPFIDEKPANTNAWTNELIVLSDDSLTPTRCRRWELSFDLLLKDQGGRDLFEEHLKREFSSENFEFYSKCVELKFAPLSKVEELAQEIFENFISRDSLTPININEETLSYATSEYEEGRFRHAFHPALIDIYVLMKGDSYRRFLSTLPCQDKDVEKEAKKDAEEEEEEEAEEAEEADDEDDIDEGVEEDVGDDIEEEDAEEEEEEEAEEEEAEEEEAEEEDAEEEEDEGAEEDIEEEAEEDVDEDDAEEDAEEYADEDIDEELDDED